MLNIHIQIFSLQKSYIKFENFQNFTIFLIIFLKQYLFDITF